MFSDQNRMEIVHAELTALISRDEKNSFSNSMCRRQKNPVASFFNTLELMIFSSYYVFIDLVL